LGAPRFVWEKFLGARFRRFAGNLLLGGLGLVLLLPELAAAQSCFSMQTEMMQLRSRATRSSDTDRYEQAYREQADVIARTEARARNAGCFGTGFFLFRRTPDPSCNVLVPKLREMQANLARLDQMRRQGGGSPDIYRMRELEGMMASRGCDLPRGGLYTSTPNDNWFERQPYSGGTYRTLCVRTCDGYYFPISFSTTSDRFPEDQQTCEAMCPGTEALLFYHPNPGGGPENMISITGEPYSALPTAFQYRKNLDSTCTCKPAGGYQITAVAQSAPLSIAPREAPIDLTAPLPRPRPAPGEDPETLADRAGYFVPRTGAAEPDGGIPVATSASGSPIRIVGPSLGNAAQDALVITPVPN
jgi:Protein of unknown function (DUF2865)